MSYKTVTVLLVDDDDVDVMSVERAFKVHHIKNPLVKAVNGLAALELLRGERRSKNPLSVPILILQILICQL